MENVSNLSLIEVAIALVKEKNAPTHINDIIDEVLELKGLDDDESRTNLYVDITTSSSFVYLGDGMWDLKINQKLEEFDKDGADFTKKEDLSDLEPEDDFDEDDDEDEDEDEDEDSDEDEDDEDSDEFEEEDEPEEEYEDEESEEFDEDSDDYDEEKYNKIMDDYEDMYGDN